MRVTVNVLASTQKLPRCQTGSKVTTVAGVFILPEWGGLHFWSVPSVCMSCVSVFPCVYLP